MDVLGGEHDTMFDARQQMRPKDVMEERCEICSLIGLYLTETPNSDSPFYPC